MTSVAAWFLKKAQHRQIATIALLIAAGSFALQFLGILPFGSIIESQFTICAYAFGVWIITTAPRVLQSLPRNDDAACDLLLIAEGSFLRIFLARLVAFLIEWLLVLAALIPVAIALSPSWRLSIALGLYTVELALLGVPALLIVPWYLTRCRGSVIRMAVFAAATAYAIYALPAIHISAHHGPWLLAYGAFLLAFAAATPDHAKPALRIAVKGARVSPGSLIQFLGFGLSPLPRVIIHPLIETALIALVGIALLLFAPYAALASLVIGPIASAGYMNKIVASGKIDDLRLAAIPFTRIARAMQAACLLRGLVFSLVALTAIARVCIDGALSENDWLFFIVGGLTAAIMYVSAISIALNFGAYREHFFLTGAGSAIGVFVLTFLAGCGLYVFAVLVLRITWAQEGIIISLLVGSAILHLLVAIYAFLRFPDNLYLACAALGAWLSSNELSARKYDLAILQWQEPMRDES